VFPRSSVAAPFLLALGQHASKEKSAKIPESLGFGLHFSQAFTRTLNPTAPATSFFAPVKTRLQKIQDERS
jgi:hypothetical protein